MAYPHALLTVMCNDYEQHVSHAEYAQAISALELASPAHQVAKRRAFMTTVTMMPAADQSVSIDPPS